MKILLVLTLLVLSAGVTGFAFHEWIERGALEKKITVIERNMLEVTESCRAEHRRLMDGLTAESALIEKNLEGIEDCKNLVEHLRDAAIIAEMERVRIGMPSLIPLGAVLQQKVMNTHVDNLVKLGVDRENASFMVEVAFKAQVEASLQR